MSKKQITVRLPDGDLNDLKRLAKVKGDDTASRAAFLIQKALDEAKQSGEIPEQDIEESLEQVAEYIKVVMGLRTRNGISFDEIAEITGLTRQQLEEFYEFVESCRKNHTPHQSPK